MEVIPWKFSRDLPKRSRHKILPERTCHRQSRDFQKFNVVTQFKKMLRAKLNRTAYAITASTTTNRNTFTSSSNARS